MCKTIADSGALVDKNGRKMTTIEVFNFLVDNYFDIHDLYLIIVDINQKNKTHTASIGGGDDTRRSRGADKQNTQTT